jgi:hypothetical protein
MANTSVNTSIPAQYTDANARQFKTFTDPNEGAFSLEVPFDWTVTNGSGLVRPYIDAAVFFSAGSPSWQGFSIQDPYGYIYATPNAVLDFAGFHEGSLYDVSGGIAKPMMVGKYMSASEFASGLLAKSNLTSSNVSVIERPDLLSPGSSMITQQSAAEMAFDYVYNGTKMKSVVLVRTSLVELSGTGVWYATVMEYYSPVALFDETELEALAMQRSFKVNSTWAAREQVEVHKRLGIISQNQNDISDIISSTFEMRSKSMDKLNQKWDNYILGIEDVYDTDSNTHYVVDSGSKYYWADINGNVYGTDVAVSPLPNENLKLLDCPGC